MGYNVLLLQSKLFYFGGNGLRYYHLSKWAKVALILKRLNLSDKNYGLYHSSFDGHSVI